MILRQFYVDITYYMCDAKESAFCGLTNTNPYNHQQSRCARGPNKCASSVLVRPPTPWAKTHNVARRRSVVDPIALEAATATTTTYYRAPSLHFAQVRCVLYCVYCVVSCRDYPTLLYRILCVNCGALNTYILAHIIVTN